MRFYELLTNQKRLKKKKKQINDFFKLNSLNMTNCIIL